MISKEVEKRENRHDKETNVQAETDMVTEFLKFPTTVKG